MEGWAEGISSRRTTRHVKAARGTWWAPAQAKFSPWMKEGGQPWSTIQPAPVHRRQAARGASPQPVGAPPGRPATAAVETEASVESQRNTGQWAILLGLIRPIRTHTAAVVLWHSAGTECVK